MTTRPGRRHRVRTGRVACPTRARRSRRVLLVPLVVGLVLAGAVGGSSAAPPAPNRLARPGLPPDRPTRVLVLGDSVMLGAATAYAPALPGRDVTVDAAVSRSTAEGAEVLATRGTDWDVVVVMLAHNDGGSPGVYQPAARRILDQLAGVPRVVWLTIHEVRPYYPEVNRFLRDEATRRPNLRVADWNAVAAANPGAVAGDGLHLTGSGAALLAGLVADQVALAEVELAPPPTTTTVATTTTAPTTTTTVAVRLIPPISIDRPPPPSTTETPALATHGSGSDRGDDRRDDRPDPEEDGGDPVPTGFWAVLVTGMVGSTLVGRRLARRAPA